VKSAIAMTMVMTMVPALAGAQTPIPAGADQTRRHEQISIFEGALVGAVKLAAGRVAKDVQAHTSGANFFSGEARAKGFTLDGYGVFVYVEIPALDLTLTLNVMLDQLEREQRRAETEPGPGPVSNKLDPRPEPKIPSVARDALQSVQDTGQKYRNEVKIALADAMLDFSKNLELKPDEWLSVAARGNEGALTPGEVLQLTTVVLRVKGSDLADYLAGRTTKEEARQKVEVRLF
jgi:hypothetical protein